MKFMKKPLFEDLYKVMLYENNAVNYVRSFNTLMSKGNFNKKQTEYWSWQAKVVEPVSCVSYKDIPGLPEKIYKFLGSYTPQKKECYYNSVKCTWEVPGVEYVEGIADLIIPLNHAWNFYEGYYFDLTAEIALEDDVTSFDYAEIIHLDGRDMNWYAAKTGMAGEYIEEYYLNNIKGKN